MKILKHSHILYQASMKRVRSIGKTREFLRILKNFKKFQTFENLFHMGDWISEENDFLKLAQKWMESILKSQQRIPPNGKNISWLCEQISKNNNYIPII